MHRSWSNGRWPICSRVFELAGAGDGASLARPAAPVCSMLRSTPARIASFFARIAEQAPSVFAAVTSGVERRRKDTRRSGARIWMRVSPNRRSNICGDICLLPSPPSVRERGSRVRHVFRAGRSTGSRRNLAPHFEDSRGKGLPFDRMAILLRSPDRYQPVMEDALRRARKSPRISAAAPRVRTRVAARFSRCWPAPRKNARPRDSPNICRSGKSRRKSGSVGLGRRGGRIASFRRLPAPTFDKREKPSRRRPGRSCWWTPR